MSKPWRLVHHIVHTLVLVGQGEPGGVGSLQRFQSIETWEGNCVSPSFLGELMAEEFVCCSAGIMHLFLIFFVLSNCRLATFHKKVHDHRYLFFLDWVQVDEAWTEGPSKTPYHKILFEAVFGKVQTFWVLRELPETQPDRTKAGKMDFFKQTYPSMIETQT